MPVASQGSVKAIAPDDLDEIGIEIVLSNTYHLYLRPGIEIIESFGGLHQFMNWKGPILTDSGGYQVFSLSPLRKVSDAGVTFRSHIDGSEHYFTPEAVVQYQEKLGVDIMMVLDECIAIDQPKEKVKSAMERTHRWALRCLKQHEKNRQLLFAIVQGGLFEDLRKESAAYMADYDFPGFAIGGLSLGEPKEQTWMATETVTGILPENKPRYLMGVGSPEDIVQAVSLGVDIFDSALPTRVARNGALFTRSGRKNIYRANFKSKQDPVDPDCDCYTCRNFSAAYLHHLFKASELLAYRLATIHNLRFIMRLIKDIREAIDEDKYRDFRNKFLERYKTTNEEERISQKKKWMAAKTNETPDSNI
jgi:queuine tRNA-ribosyltransferase